MVPLDVEVFPYRSFPQSVPLRWIHLFEFELRKSLKKFLSLHSLSRHSLSLSLIILSLSLFSLSLFYLSLFSLSLFISRGRPPSFSRFSEKSAIRSREIGQQKSLGFLRGFFFRIEVKLGAPEKHYTQVAKGTIEALAPGRLPVSSSAVYCARLSGKFWKPEEHRKW